MEQPRTTTLLSFLICLFVVPLALAFGVAATATQVPDPSDASLSSIDRLRALIERMKVEQQGFQTLTARFEQVTTSEMLVEPERSSGTFSFQAPDKVRWEYRDPTPKLIVINGKDLVTWYQDLGRAEKVEVGRYSDAVFRYLGASGSLETLMDYFSLQVRFPEGEEPYQVDLEPRYRRVERRLKEMSVAIDSERFVPVRLHYTEPNGDSTEYRFSNFRINERLPPAHFDLTLPANVEVRVVSSSGQ